MDGQKSIQTIICYRNGYLDHPWFVLTPAFVETFTSAASTFQFKESKLNRLLLAFDCFLHITGTEIFQLTDLTKKNRLFVEQAESFIGAIYSPSFLDVSHYTRYSFAYALRATLIEMRKVIPVPICDYSVASAFDKSNSKLLDIRISSSTRQHTPFVSKCIRKFEALPPFDEEALYLWRGWPATNLSGKTTWLRLYPVYERLGRNFTDALYEQARRYFEGRHTGQVPALNALAKFIGEFPGDISPADFKSPNFVTRFWPEFLIFYITNGDAEGISLPTMSTLWRNEFIFFANEYLVATGLFAESYGPIPMPPVKSGPDKRTNIRKGEDGVEMHAKLLVSIPLQVSDTTAMEILFHQLEDHVALLLQWARSAASDLWSRSERRRELAKTGIARARMQVLESRIGTGFLISESNRHRFSNACASYETHGHLTGQDEVLSLMFPGPLPDIAHFLGLPTTASLLPHLTILVATHPSITPSFLEHLELYDKNGNDYGKVDVDGATILRSSKGRRGPVQSWQEITLTAETAEIVEQIIGITKPLRDYLQDRNDDSWRYLLLTCGQGFAYPSRVLRIASDTSIPHRVQATAEAIHTVSGRAIEECEILSNQFSLPSLRATAGVLVYLRTKDVRKMAEALGHASYERSLLSRYLPEAILTFFQERWIRIFQTSMIVDALKDSDYLIPASGFKNIQELNDFLSTHMLRKIPGIGVENAPEASSNKVLFGLDVPVLTALVSLQMSVRQATKEVNEATKYWQNIGDSLINYIDSETCAREDLRQYLSQARAQADPTVTNEVIYD